MSRRGVLGLSAAAVVAATAAVTTATASASESEEPEEHADDVHATVIECLADLNRRPQS